MVNSKRSKIKPRCAECGRANNKRNKHYAPVIATPQGFLCPKCYDKSVMMQEGTIQRRMDVVG